MIATKNPALINNVYQLNRFSSSFYGYPWAGYGQLQNDRFEQRHDEHHFDHKKSDPPHRHYLLPRNKKIVSTFLITYFFPSRVPNKNQGLRPGWLCSIDFTFSPMLEQANAE